MTINEAKLLLEKHRIPYHTAQYENEAEYYHHLTPFPYTDNARKCQVIALVIPSVNGVKDIELQFNRHRGEYEFRELWFGGYSFELLYEDPELIETSIFDFIGQIVDGKLAIIQANDLKNKRCVSDGSFDLTDEDDVFGEPGYREAIAKIEAPKTFWQQLRKKRIQYDIYDWRTHRQIIK